MLSCKEVSMLLSQAQERRLGLWDQLGLRLHLTLCSGCANFSRQLVFLRTAVRRYLERGD